MALIGETVKRYIEQYPNTPNLTLANLIFQQNIELFKSTETARDAIRYYKGQHGKENLARLSTKEFVQDEPNPYNPFDAIPEGITYFDDWTPHYIKGKKILVLGDIHAPYHIKSALINALKEGKEYGVDTILFMGDLTDYYQASRYEKDPRKRNLKYEIDTTKSILKFVREMFPNADIIIQEGNHDERMIIYLKVKAPVLLELEIANTEQLLKTNELGITVVKDKRFVKVGKHLHLIHGHEFGKCGSGGVNPARWLYLRGHENAVCGHFHRSSNHTERSMGDKVVSCWSIGCLCDLRPEYLPVNNWNHGFAIIERDGDDFEVHNKRIINGKVY